jgi:protocatechuate 3,4-dioxygenase alpha subunit
VSAPATPSQTIGPFFHVALPCPAPARFGQRDGVSLIGRVIDGDGAAVGDALVEMWDGRDLARCATDPEGMFEFVLPVDDIVADTPGDAAPYVAVAVFARGLLRHVVTRCYLPAETVRLDRDAVLAATPADRRHTLLARLDGDVLRFDVRLQGEGETVFHEW